MRGDEREREEKRHLEQGEVGREERECSVGVALDGAEEEEGGEEEGGHRQPHQEDGQEGVRHHDGALQGAGHTAHPRRRT